jgi:hypothetical protein
MVSILVFPKLWWFTHPFGFCNPVRIYGRKINDDDDTIRTHNIFLILCNEYTRHCSWDSVVRTVTGLQAGQSSNCGFIPSRGNTFFPSPSVQTTSANRPAYRRGVSMAATLVKQLKCEAHHSLPSSAKVKNGWSYTSTPYVFMVCIVHCFNSVFNMSAELNKTEHKRFKDISTQPSFHWLVDKQTSRCIELWLFHYWKPIENLRDM